MYSFTLPFKPISYNHYYQWTCRGRRAMPYKTKKGKDWDLIADKYFSEIQSDLANLKNRISDTTLVTLDIQYYLNNFFTKKDKRINSLAGDVDNFNKVLIDKIFKCIGVDDKYLISVNAIKTPAPFEDKIHVKLGLSKYPFI